MVFSLTGATVNALIGTIRTNPSVNLSQAFNAFEAGEADHSTVSWCGGGVGQQNTLFSTAHTKHVIVTMEGHLTNVPGGTPHGTEQGAQVLANIWDLHGEKALPQLEGSFAATILNLNTGILTLIADRFASRPIYLTQGPDVIAYSTHLPELLKMPWCERKLNRAVLSEYLSFNTVHAPRTLVSGLTQIPPGHTARVNQGSLNTTKYWSMTYAPIGAPTPSTGDYVKSLHIAKNLCL